ncbi:MAG: YbaY family lipoprotein [Azonexus sp.]|nr:YbaY family lipoprotein [Azonexus sp.]
MKNILPLLLVLPAFGAQAQAVFNYRCDDGSTLNVRFQTPVDGEQTAILALPGGDFSLPQGVSSSGARYARGPVSLWIKGQDALFETGRASRRCTTPTPLGSFIEITGSVTYLARIALPPAANLTIKVEDVARADAPAKILAEQHYALAGAQVPIPFKLTLDRDLAGPRARLVISARIDTNGQPRFQVRQPYRPLAAHDGQIDLILKPVRATR